MEWLSTEERDAVMSSSKSRSESTDLHDCRVLAMVMAGGKGERLLPLTGHRAKSAVPFGGMCRIIDFVMSNMVNSGISKIYILTQYKAQSLLRHLQQGWTIIHPMNGYTVMPVPSQMQRRDTWYLGMADSVYQNLDLIRRERPDVVLVFGSDHVYSMDIRQMIASHLENDAEVTVATIPPCRPTSARISGPCVWIQAGEYESSRKKYPVPPPFPAGRSRLLFPWGITHFSPRFCWKS